MKALLKNITHVLVITKDLDSFWAFRARFEAPSATGVKRFNSQGINFIYTPAANAEARGANPNYILAIVIKRDDEELTEREKSAIAACRCKIVSVNDLIEAGLELREVDDEES